MRNIHKIIVHCSVSNFGDAALIRTWHTDPKPKGRGWRDIGYHFVICNGFRTSGCKYDPTVDGLVETGRPVEQVGAHCAGHNSDSIGVCLIGDRLFTGRQLYEALPELLYSLIGNYELEVNDIHGHYEFNGHKSCPNIDIYLIRNAVLDLRL